MILLHGTTRLRADRIISEGPDPSYQEPGGQTLDGGFSTNLEIGPFLFGSVEGYAIGKSREFPNEGGPVVLAVDVPAEIVQKAASDWFPLKQGLIQFDYGSGLEELLDVWPNLSKEIRSVT